MPHTRVTIAMLTILVWFCAGVPMAQARVAVQALADKSDGVIVFYDGQAQELARFDAAFGRARGPKTREGDFKTPEGDYWLHPGRPSTQWGWFMPIDYPNENDVARARAAGQNPRDLGGAIGLHPAGEGFVHRIRQSFGENWTWGCIAVGNDDLVHIRSMVVRPIPIRIVP